MEQPELAREDSPRSHPTSWPGRVAIVTDSVSQVSPEAARRLGITIVPVRLILGNEELRDGIDITPAELYRRMREDKVLPRTSGASVGEYQQVFVDLLRAGAQAIVYLALSGRLSMGCGAAKDAAELLRGDFPDRRVEVVDTCTAASAEGFIAVRAARLAAAGRPADEIVASALAMRHRVGLVATVGTLEYLVRGGRVGHLAAALGSLLQVKPLLTILEDGSAALLARVRTNGAALGQMVEYVAAKTAASPRVQLAVMQADAAQEAGELRRLAESRWPSAEIVVTDFTPVMGAHTGPGLVGLAYCFD